MEIIAILGGMGCFIFGIITIFDRYEENSVGIKCIIAAALFQLFWLPQTFELKTETETYITNRHENYVFEKPVKITKTRTYKPLSTFTDETIYTIEFIKGE